MQARHEPCNNRCAYVVRQIAGNPRLGMRIQKRLQVKLQKVDVYNVEVLVVLEFFIQDLNALLVNFDSGKFQPAVEQVLRESAVTSKSPAMAVAVSTSRKFCPNLRRRALSMTGNIEIDAGVLDLQKLKA